MCVCVAKLYMAVELLLHFHFGLLFFLCYQVVSAIVGVFCVCTKTNEQSCFHANVPPSRDAPRANLHRNAISF